MAEGLGGTEWVAAQRDATRTQGQNHTAYIRTRMTHRRLPTMEPLPPMTKPQPAVIAPPTIPPAPP